MMQEYLIKSKSILDSVKDYSSTKIKQKVTSAKEFYVLSISIDSNSENSAKVLSKINDEVVGIDEVIVISNGSSEYFNKKLYPIINEFERKLRKLVYLAVFLGKPNQGKRMEQIENLEEKDLGAIFEYLFIDPNFIKVTKTMINSKLPPLSNKKKILDSIESIEEKTLWNDLIGNHIIGLSEKYIEVKNARNAVMHAHNINYSRYKEIKELYENINSELDQQIQDFYNPEKDKYDQIAVFNTRLDEIMKQLAADITSVTRPINRSVEDFAKAFTLLLSSSLDGAYNDQISQLLSSNKAGLQLRECLNMVSKNNRDINIDAESEECKKEDKV